MMLSCNRFAFVPHLCYECKRYIWLEGYRRADVIEHGSIKTTVDEEYAICQYCGKEVYWIKFADRSIKENICKHCLTKFDVGDH